jgi:hypothetical protein
MRPETEVCAMIVRRDLLLLAILPAAFAFPALGQTAQPSGAAGTLSPVSAAEMFTGIWWHPSLPWFEPLSSGPKPVTNRVRNRAGASEYAQLVGDYTNPILQPWAAEVVKEFGERSLSGEVYPNPANQCWPEPLPFIYKNFAITLLQKPNEITIIHEQDHEIRKIRMNQQHPANLKPLFYGDSVGHWEGDTLVVDTVGVKVDRPYAMIDLFGTPYTDKLHVVERYRLIDFEEAKDGMDRDAKENWRPGAGGVNRNYRGKYLQLHVTVEDPGVFTMPWSATITYARGSTQWPETVCAENRFEFNGNAHVPTADKPDF